jgi:hypothetical protein
MSAVCKQRLTDLRSLRPYQMDTSAKCVYRYPEKSNKFYNFGIYSLDPKVEAFWFKICTQDFTSDHEAVYTDFTIVKCKVD